jgi:serine/threonine protein kinase
LLHSKGVVKVVAAQKEVYMEDLTGKQLGSYQIIAPIGEGGMAAVYKAYQLGKMNRYVALKVLPQQLAKESEFVGRFNQEANVLAKLQHPRILPVFDFGEAEGYMYIVMPFVDSGTLADSLHGNPLPLPQVRSFTVQVAEALDYAHARGLVHRDVKPSNVLVDERGNCLLSDFGISKILEGTEKFTATGGVIGTPAYMSPEQGRGETLDARSDIYSVGIMLYEMATGRVPFKAETPIAVIFKHIQDPLPPPRSINPALPEAVEQVIFKALAKRPEDRYQTAGDMARAIKAAIPESVGLSEPLESANAPIEPGAVTIQATSKVQTMSPTAIAEKPQTGLPKWIPAVGGLALIAIIVLAVVIGSNSGISIANQSTVTPAPTTAVHPTAVPPTVVSLTAVSPAIAPTSATEVANWAVSFVYNFPTPFWTAGTHEYTLLSACSSVPDLNGTWTRSFQVSDNAQLIPTPIYLRLGGLYTESLATGRATIEIINPAQSTSAIWSAIQATRSEIDKIVAGCKVSISWDGGSPQILVVQEPFQR